MREDYLISNDGTVIPVTDHVEPGKPVVAIDGAVVGTLFDVFRDGDTLIDALRRRAAHVGASYAVLDEFSALGEGGTAKYLAPLRARQLTTCSLLKLTSALGMRAQLVVDPKLVAKMAPLYEKRNSAKVHSRRSPPLGQATLRRVLPAAVAELGRRGGRAWVRKTTPQQRRELGRRGAQIRWGRRTNAAATPS